MMGRPNEEMCSHELVAFGENALCFADDRVGRFVFNISMTEERGLGFLADESEP